MDQYFGVIACGCGGFVGRSLRGVDVLCVMTCGCGVDVVGLRLVAFLLVAWASQ